MWKLGGLSGEIRLSILKLSRRPSLKTIADWLQIVSATFQTAQNWAIFPIPNDVTNESRALYVLKNAGLIKLDTSRGALATVKDIRDNPKGLIIKEIDASQTPRALDSVAAAVINYNFAISAKISEKESIYQEPLNEDSAQWINFIAANQSDKNNKVYKEVVKAYEQKNIADTIKKEYPDGGELPAWNLKL